MITGVQVTVAASATLIAAVGYDRKRSVCVQNNSGVDVFLGDNHVTTSAYGYKLADGTAITIDMARNEKLYGVVATGTAAVGVLASGE